MINYYRITRVQLLHQNGDTHYQNFKEDVMVKDLEKYREQVKEKFHAQAVYLNYTTIEEPDK